MDKSKWTNPEAEFLDVIGTKVLRVFLLVIHSHPLQTGLNPPLPPPSKIGLKLVCNVNILYGNLKSKESHKYAQIPQLNGTFMNSASACGVKGPVQCTHRAGSFGRVMVEKSIPVIES
jgi:hypothetical protein